MLAFLKYLPPAGYNVRMVVLDSLSQSPEYFRQRAEELRDKDVLGMLSRVVVGYEAVEQAFQTASAVVILGVHHGPLKYVLSTYGKFLANSPGKLINVQCHNGGQSPPLDSTQKKLVDRFDGVLLNNWKQVLAFRQTHPGFRGLAGVSLYGATFTHERVQNSPSTGSDGSVIFVGDIRHPAAVKLMVGTAEQLPGTTFNIIVGRSSPPGVEALVHHHNTTNFPRNIKWLLVPKGGEDVYCEKASIALDFSWSSSWTYDNSKVSMYFSYGLDVVATPPSPSLRFLAATNSGAVLPPLHSATVEDLLYAVKSLQAVASVERKERIKLQAAMFTSWKVASQHLIDMLDALLL